MSERLPPIECTAWECQELGCWEWHETKEGAEKCCPPCKCRNCDGDCRDAPQECPAIKCPDCGYLDDIYGRKDMEARQCCSVLPVEQPAACYR